MKKNHGVQYLHGCSAVIQLYSAAKSVSSMGVTLELQAFEIVACFWGGNYNFRMP